MCTIFQCNAVIEKEKIMCTYWHVLGHLCKKFFKLDMKVIVTNIFLERLSM